jgi:hypothetical protein
MHYEVVRADEGNRGPPTISFAKQFDKLFRSELGEANRGDRTSGRRAHRIPPERDEIIN